MKIGLGAGALGSDIARLHACSARQAMANPDSDPILERVRAFRIDTEGIIPRLRKEVVPPDLQDLLEYAEVLGATDDGYRADIGKMLPGSYLEMLRGRVAERRSQIEAFLRPDAPHELEPLVFMALLDLVDETEPLLTPVPPIAEQNRGRVSDTDFQQMRDRLRRAMNLKAGGGHGESGS
jgi:hypothetical protein